MEVTKREIIISIAIASAMMIIGFFISGEITDFQNDKNAEYQKAAHIENSELFQYGMDTNIGNAFVYGELRAIDTVSFDGINGEYLCIEKIKERYERHTRTVTKIDQNGNKRTETEVYYEWEADSTESKHSENIMFCGIKFPYHKIPYCSNIHIKTINSDKEYSFQSGCFVKVRFRYYGTPVSHTGTLYTRLSDGTISDNSRFFNDYTIEQAVDNCTSGIVNVVFWGFWIALTVGAVIGFCYLDNRWLEN